MESSNSGYLQAQEELKLTRLKQDAEQKARDSFLTSLIEKSSSLKTKVGKLVDGKNQKGNKKDRLREALNEIEMSVA